jgi:hypothetical protein
MFVPMLPDVGVDQDVIVLIEQSRDLAAKAFKKKVKARIEMMREALTRRLEKWAKEGGSKEEFARWMKAASPIYHQVLPSLLFDVEHLPKGLVLRRLKVIEAVVSKLAPDQRV